MLHSSLYHDIGEKKAISITHIHFDFNLAHSKVSKCWKNEIDECVCLATHSPIWMFGLKAWFGDNNNDSLKYWRINEICDFWPATNLTNLFLDLFFYFETLYAQTNTFPSISNNSISFCKLSLDINLTIITVVIVMDKKYDQMSGSNEKKNEWKRCEFFCDIINKSEITVMKMRFQFILQQNECFRFGAWSGALIQFNR